MKRRSQNPRHAEGAPNVDPSRELPCPCSAVGLLPSLGTMTHGNLPCFPEPRSMLQWPFQVSFRRRWRGLRLIPASTHGWRAAMSSPQKLSFTVAHFLNSLTLMRSTHLSGFPCSACSLIPGRLPPAPCHSTLWTQNCRNWLHVFCHQHLCVTPITKPPSLPVCPLPWSQSLSLPLPSVYWLLAPSLTWKMQERTFRYSFWAPESHNWRTGRNLMALIVKASSNVDFFFPSINLVLTL